MGVPGKQSIGGYKALSLFSGACGLDAGVHETKRFDLLGCLEVSPVFCDTIRRNLDDRQFGSAETQVFEGDIRSSQHRPRRIMKKLGLRRGELDLLMGGPPCQAFSTAGRRQSVADERGDLLWSYLEFVIETQPKYFILENVRGLLSAALRHRPIARRPENGGPRLNADEVPGSVVVRWMEDLVRESGGLYRVDCFEVNAVNYGAPQLRERVLMIGNRLGDVVDFPPQSHGPIERVERGESPLLPYRTLRDAIGHMHEDTPTLLDFSPRKKGYLAMVPPGGNWRALPESVQQESMGRAFHAKGGRSGWWRRLAWDLPCPTLVTMPNHASTSMCHPDEVRALSVAEYAAIQEFPDDWRFAGKVQQKYEQAGNAVPSRLGRIAADLIADRLEVLGSRRRRVPSGVEPFRRVYLGSHVRTRRWFKAGQVFVWSDRRPDPESRYYHPSP